MGRVKFADVVSIRTHWAMRSLRIASPLTEKHSDAHGHIMEAYRHLTEIQACMHPQESTPRDSQVQDLEAQLAEARSRIEQVYDRLCGARGFLRPCPAYVNADARIAEAQKMLREDTADARGE